MQGAIGNQAVNQLLARQPIVQAKPLFRGLSQELAIQPKLTIGNAGDKYEQEADRVASQINQINLPANQIIQSKEMTEKDDAELMMKPMIQRLADSGAGGMAATPSFLAIQAKLTIGKVGDKYEQEADRVASQVVEQTHAPTAQPTQGQSVQRQEEPEEELQAKPSISELQMSPLLPEVQPEVKPEEEDLQAKSIIQPGEAIAVGEVSTDLDTAINSARGSGQPLDANLQQSMGQAFGADFSGVRVHKNGTSDRLNRSIQAKAFTTGQDIFFRQGVYEPSSRGGQELIAHELTHVVQQNSGAVQRSPLLPQQANATQGHGVPEGKELFSIQFAPVQRTGMEKVVLQRKIGFEFELSTWNTWRADPATDLNEITTIQKPYDTYGNPEDYTKALASARTNREMWKPMTKGDILVENNNAEITADEMGDKTNLELRTVALDETNAGQVKTAVDLFETILDEMGTEYILAMKEGHQLRANELRGTVKFEGSFFETDRPNQQKGKPQATTGLRLESLPSLIRNLYPDPDETNPERTRRGEGRLKGTGFDQNGQLSAGSILRTLGAAPGKAETAIATFLAKHKNAPKPASEKLQGLVALLIAYMDMGKKGLVRSYAKTIAPIMARTDFATMFAMLPDNERDYYSGKHGGKFVDLLKGAGYDWGKMSQSIYSAGIQQSSEPNTWYKDLKRKDWLKAMTAPSTGTGTDQLTPAYYPTQRGKKQIEALGGYANRTDPVTTGQGVIQVPILELRSLPEMTPQEFSDFAVKLARLLIYLNTNQDKTFGEL